MVPSFLQHHQSSPSSINGDSIILGLFELNWGFRDLRCRSSIQRFKRSMFGL
ncbi:hypothetical protein LguiB_020401 [Lonicera macranthoides]